MDDNSLVTDMSNDIDSSIKAGARHSAGDMGHIQAAHDSTVKAGAMCEGAGDTSASEAAAVKMFGDILDDPGVYAQHECQDIMQAASALQNLVILLQSELSEEDEDPQDVGQLVSAARILGKFILSELDEVQASAEEDVAEDAGAPPTVGHEGTVMEGKAVNYDQAAQLVRDAWAQAHPSQNGQFAPYPMAVFDDAIIIGDKGSLYRIPYEQKSNAVAFAARAQWEEVRQAYLTADGSEIKFSTLPTEGKAADPFHGKRAKPFGEKHEDLTDADYGDPANKKYPIATAEDVSAAAHLIGKADDPEAVKKRIIAIAKRKGFDLPSAWESETKKSVDPDGLKGIELLNLDDGEELAVLPGYSVKAIDGNEGWTTGYLIRFGGSGDLSKWKDIFSSETDYGHAKTSDVWTHHRMLPGAGKRRLTNPAEIDVDEVGVTIKHLLDLRDPYEKALYSLTKQNKLGWSSGVPPHLVERKTLEGGRHAIQSWILGTDASYTPCPAGGFDVNASAMKSLFDDAGIDLLQAIYEAPEVKTDAPTDTDRARAFLLELDLLELEATADMAG